MAFNVSTAKVSIAPTLSTNPYMAGYGTQGGPRVAISSTPYDEPLYARCVILWDGTFPNAIITLDLLAIPRSMSLTLRPRLLALAGWENSDIMLSSTHTHNGPVIVDDLHPWISYGLTDLTLVRSYSAWLQDTIVQLVRTALAAAQTAVTLDYKVATANIALNRAGLPTVETQVPVLTARNSNGAPRAVIFSYGCHPVSAGWGQFFDGDFPAGACTAIEANNPGCFAIFLQGAAGDQNPTGVSSWALRDSHSAVLGSVVTTAARSAGRAVTGPLQTIYQDVPLPLDIDTSAANLAALRSVFVARMSNPLGEPDYYQRHAQAMISRIDSGNGTTTTTVPNPLQVWKLQGSPILRIAMTGGELVSGYAAYFRSRYGGANGLLIGGYANEVSCYVPANNFFPPYKTSGSYEGGWDTDWPNVAGGSMTVYAHLAHFKAGTGGVESTLIAALTALLG